MAHTSLKDKNQKELMYNKQKSWREVSQDVIGDGMAWI